MSPRCAKCDRPVEVLSSGVMVHSDGSGHEEWPTERPYEHVLSDDTEPGDLG